MFASTTVPVAKGLPAVVQDLECPNATPSEEHMPLLQEASTRSTVSEVGTSEYGSSSRRDPRIEMQDNVRKVGWGGLKEKVNGGDFFVHHHDAKSERGSSSKPKWSDFEVPHELKTSECLKLASILALIGTIAFSFIFERWSILDSLYFSIVLLTTVGYGDICPSTPGGKLFASAFALTGVALLGLVLGELGSRAVDAQMEYMEKVRDQSTVAVEAAFRHPEEEDDKREHEETDSSTERFNYLEADSQDLRESIGIEPFRSMNVCRLTMAVLGRYLPVIVPLFVGAAVAGRFLEHWEWYDLIYFSVVTATTIGFGDLTPSHDVMKLVAIFSIPVAVAVMGYILGEIATIILDKRREQHEKKLWTTDLTAEDLVALDSNKDGKVYELDYVKFMLIAMKKVDGKLFDDLHRQFELLDRTNNGNISMEDLKIMAKQRIHSASNKVALLEYKQHQFEKAAAHSRRSIFASIPAIFCESNE